MPASASIWHLHRLAPALMAVLAIAILPEAAALAQQSNPPVLEASRHNLSFGRYDGVRSEGIAGLTPDDGRFYRNVPGITGPGGLFDIIGQQGNPLLISFRNRDNGNDPEQIVDAGRRLPPGFSLVVLENVVARGLGYDSESFVRFGEGNFYATVTIPGTGIVPGTELVTVDQFAVYTANSVLWEAPDISDVVLDTKISGGTVNVGAILNRPKDAIATTVVGGRPYKRNLGYANPLEVNIEIVSQRKLPDGSCRVRLRADLSPTFGNAIVRFPQETYTWFRWAIEGNDTTLITDVPGTDLYTFDLPHQNVSDQVGLTVVASSFGPAVIGSTLPVTLNTNPFIEPAVGPVGLGTFHSYASTLGDTETLWLDKCEEQPLEVTKLADPTEVPGEGGNVTYTVTAHNTSNKARVIVRAVTDDRLGDLAARCRPSLPATLPPRGSLTCEITAPVTGAAESTVTNTVNVVGEYADDGTPVAASASAEVKIGAATRVATCNSATGAGSDQPETIDVDLGDFQGTAAFAWEMYTVKDRMILTAGGRVLHDTQCASGSGRVKFQVPPGATKLKVAVEPNCEGTTGTQWNFHFQCPADEGTRVPKVLGLKLKDAVERVKDARLRPHPALGNPAKERDQEPLTVYQSKPAEGTEVAEGDAVVLTAYGERPKHAIPQTEGMTLAGANQKLSSSDFTPVAPSLGDPAPADKTPGRVERTEPPAGTVAELFSEVKPVLYGAHTAVAQPVVEAPEEPGEPQIGGSCGAQLSEAVRQAMAKDLYDTYENGKWKEKRKFNDIRTWEIHNQLRALILRGNYFAIHYEINRPAFQARIACKDSCIMATPKNYQIHEPAWRPFKDCIAACDKIKFYTCDLKGRITKLGTPLSGVTRR